MSSCKISKKSLKPSSLQEGLKGQKGDLVRGFQKKRGAKRGRSLPAEKVKEGGAPCHCVRLPKSLQSSFKHPQNLP